MVMDVSGMNFEPVDVAGIDAVDEVGETEYVGGVGDIG